MKLGDKMAPIEACNVWNDVCPRKTRPPKIGDIPRKILIQLCWRRRGCKPDENRHVAVDEESPGSSSSRSVSQVRQTSGQSRLERSSVCHTNYEKCLAPGTLPLLETLAQPPSSDSSKKLERVSRISRGLDSERAENLARSLNSNSSSIPIGKTFNAPTSIFTEISTTLDSRNPDVNVPRDSSEKNSCAQLLKSIGETIAQEDQVPEEIIQVRKDSALYIDEKESPDAEELRKSLVAIGVGPRSSIGALSHQRNVEGTKNCRFFGADGLSAARRESSGYFSNLGTFDEDRWGSSCTSELANQQETRESLRERRRSSTKNRLPMGGGQQINRMTTIVCPTNDEDAISSSDNDAFAVTKTGRIEMPNIDEQPSLETNKSIEIERSPDKEFSREESQSSKRISKISMDNSASVNKNLPIIAKSNESSKNEVVTKKLGFNNRSMDTKIAREESEMCDRISQISVDNLPSNSLVRLADNENSSSIGKNTGSSNDVVDTKELGRKLGSGDQGSQSGANNRAANRQRSRMVVHQYSSPNITNSELERILERPQSEDFLRSKRELTRVNLTETVVNISSPGGDCEEDDDEQVVAGCLRETDGNEENETDTTKLLPRSIKVYQLLATQSEDRGDGDARLFDRRISLQIARNEEEEEEAIRENACGDPLPVVCRNIPSGSEYVEEKKLVHADSVPILKIPSSDASAVENESPLCAAERISGSNNLSGPPTLGIRPIYPYCPYSPYASPQGSPRTNRRRPLRESRRVSIDSRQGALQLNQYKLLNNIGQGSFGIVKLAYNEEDGTHYAMKILSKKKLMKKAGIFGRIAPGRKGASNPLAKVYREIALLKKLDHPNVVKLVEVLDDPDEDNLYLVFELVQKGEVLQLPTDKPLDEETARINFRDVVMGVEYLHYQRIVHRDIKPSNLLVDSEGRVKVADLGVSAELRAAGELLSGSAGTPAFAAPETTTPGAQYSGTLCDVWSMGVTLYSLVTGKVPWDGAGSIIGVQSAVRSEPLRFPDTPLLSENLRDLVTRMLCKDPTRRITLAEIKEHSWITNNGKEPLPNETENCRLPVTVTDEEVARVVTRVPKLDTLILIKTMLKQHSFQNPFLPRRIVRSGCTTSDADISGTNLKKQVSSDTTDSSTEMLPTTENLKSKTEQFHKAGRSNSAPDSYEWQANGRQISSDSLLPPVAESSSQEQAEVEKR